MEECYRRADCEHVYKSSDCDKGDNFMTRIWLRVFLATHVKFAELLKFEKSYDTTLIDYPRPVVRTELMV